MGTRVSDRFAGERARTLSDLGDESAHRVLALVQVVVAEALVLHVLAQIACVQCLGTMSYERRL